MKRPDPRRVYYDHEPVYRRIKEGGGRGWDDRCAVPDRDSYEAFHCFLGSDLCPRPAPEVTALELGCGGGQAALMLAALGYSTSGVDFSPTAIELANRNAIDAGLSVRFLVEDCLALGVFESETIDLVVDNHVLHCIIGESDRAQFLQTTYRVLKLGGVFFSETMCGDVDFDAAIVEADPATRIALNRTRYWVKQLELNDELSAAGFQIEHQELRRQTDGSQSGANLVTYARRPRDTGASTGAGRP